MATQLELHWTRPEGIPDDVPVEYQIDWTPGTGGPVTTTETDYVYTARPAVLALGLEFRVTPHVGSWVGPTTRYSAAQVVLLAPISISCGILLGIL